jgi:hypothetical protein
MSDVTLGIFFYGSQGCPLAKMTTHTPIIAGYENIHDGTIIDLHGCKD